MRVDFYQLSRDPAEGVLPLLARNTLKAGERLLVVSADADQLSRISRGLWELKDSFLANGPAGTQHDARQPILLAGSLDPALAPVNGAKYLAIADGLWREGEVPFARTFFIFDHRTLDAARDVWRMLRSREGMERRFWKQEDGRWIEAG